MSEKIIGVWVVNSLKKIALPRDGEIPDGGTVGLALPEPMQRDGEVILIDATTDGAETASQGRRQHGLFCEGGINFLTLMNQK